MKKIVRLTESDLTRIVRQVINETSLLTEGVPNTVLKEETPITIASRSVCGGVDYIKGSVVLVNTGTEDAYINLAPSLKTSGVKDLSTTYEFNVTIGGKPVVGQADGQNQPKVPKGKKATLNFVIKTNSSAAFAEYQRDMKAAEDYRTSEKEAFKVAARKRLDDRRNAFKNIKAATLSVRYNGATPLEIPVTFGGFIVDGSRACDAEIMLPKGF